MRKTLFESRLDNTIDAGSIGIGETIEVRNRMGKHVAYGEVVATTPLGLSLKEGGFYDRDLYLFAVLEPDSIEIVANQLLNSPDERVAKRLAELGEEIPIIEAHKMDNNYVDSHNDNQNDDNDDNDDDDDDDDDDDNYKEPLAKPESSVDINSLPEDIKKSIISIVQMNEDQLNGVLSEIGDATIKALKRVNIKEVEIYGVVGKIQDALEKILTTPIHRSIGKKK
jgi:hypothetical protein